MKRKFTIKPLFWIDAPKFSTGLACECRYSIALMTLLPVSAIIETTSGYFMEHIGFYDNLHSAKAACNRHWKKKLGEFLEETE